MSAQFSDADKKQLRKILTKVFRSRQLVYLFKEIRSVCREIFHEDNDATIEDHITETYLSGEASFPLINKNLRKKITESHL